MDTPALKDRSAAAESWIDPCKRLISEPAQITCTRSPQESCTLEEKRAFLSNILELTWKGGFLTPKPKQIGPMPSQTHVDDQRPLQDHSTSSFLKRGFVGLVRAICDRSRQDRRDVSLSSVPELFGAGGNQFRGPEQIEPINGHSLCDSLHLFTRLEHFLVDSSPIPFPPCEWEPLPGFKATASCITVRCCIVKESTLLPFFNCFPDLKHLSLIDNSYDLDSEWPPCPPRRLRKLSFGGGAIELPLQDILPSLSNLGLSFEEIVIEGGGGCSEWAMSVAESSGLGASVNYLRLGHTRESLGNLNLTSCGQLRELEFCPKPSYARELDCISTITSMEIKKIRLNCYRDLRYNWKQLDGILVGLVDRPGYNHNPLEVEIWLVNWSSSVEELPNVQMDTHLPRFVQKGRVTVWIPQRVQVYCSDKGDDRSS